MLSFLFFFNFFSLYISDPLFLKNSFFVIFIFMFFGFLLSCVMVVIPYFFFCLSLKPVEKISEYECGFEPFDSAIRQPFTIHFYIVGILFLIFDVELVFLYPWAVVVKKMGLIALIEIIIFLFILFLGFLYAHKKGALKWK